MSIVAAYYNFSLTNRGLTLRDVGNKRVKRTPAMAAKIFNRVWPIREIIAHPMA